MTREYFQHVNPWEQTCQKFESTCSSILFKLKTKEYTVTYLKTCSEDQNFIIRAKFPFRWHNRRKNYEDIHTPEHSTPSQRKVQSLNLRNSQIWLVEEFLIMQLQYENEERG